MKEIEQAAQISVGRACGAAGFGIALTVAALSSHPVLAAKMGAVLALGLSLALLIAASRAPSTPHQTTEVRLFIDENARPQADRVRQTVNQARRLAMLWFARWTAAAAALFASSAILLELARTH